MPEFSIIFIGWFFSAISLVVLTVGGMMLMHLYKTGRLSGAYLQERGAQEIVLIAIWLVGLAAGAGAGVAARLIAVRIEMLPCLIAAQREDGGSAKQHHRQHEHQHPQQRVEKRPT